MAKFLFTVTFLLCFGILHTQPNIYSELQFPLSLIDCAGNVTALNPEFEKISFGVSRKQGEFYLIKADDVICDPAAIDHSIYILKRDFTNILQFNKIQENIIKFVDLLPLMNSDAWKNNSMFIQTIKEEKEDVIFVLFLINNKWIGFIRKLDIGLSSDVAYLNVAFEKAKTVWGIKNICWYGSETNKVDIYSIAERYGFEVFRRSTYVDTELPTFISNSDPIQSQIFEPTTSVAFNCVPTTREDLINAGFSPDNSTAWNLLKSNLNESIQNKFINKPSTGVEFKNEIINGTSDVLLMVAHSDRISIYLGNEKIEISEIKTWEERQVKNGKPRIAILLSCYAGEIEQVKTNWFFFQAQRESLTEVLLKKKYFDYIISPNHQVSGDESLQIINEILKSPSIKNLRNLFAGWHAFVFIDNQNHKNE